MGRCVTLRNDNSNCNNYYFVATAPTTRQQQQREYPEQQKNVINSSGNSNNNNKNDTRTTTTYYYNFNCKCIYKITATTASTASTTSATTATKTAIATTQKPPPPPPPLTTIVAQHQTYRQPNPITINNDNSVHGCHGINGSALCISPALSQVKNEGVPALYSGLSAALARQASYTTLRLGLYDLMKRLVIDGEILNMQMIFQESSRPEIAGYWNEA